MCGLGGYAGIRSEAFVVALGAELDARGGHAAGYVTDRHWATRKGMWTFARRKFMRRASEGNVGIIHTRFATCGTDTQRDAHPFEIRRGGVPVLYGAHNGMIDDAADSARDHGRPYTVDSRELFELIADGAFPLVQQMAGYGVASWIKPGDTAVYLARLTESGEICVVSIEGGGYAWASTWAILRDALQVAGLVAVKSYPLDVGTVYRVTPEGIYLTTETRCNLAERPRWNWRGWSERDWGVDDDELDVIIDAQSDDLFDPREGDYSPRDPWAKDDPWEDGIESEEMAGWLARNNKWRDVGRCGG